jgi:hypothetical protein
MPAYHSGSLSKTGRTNSQRDDFTYPLRPTTTNLTVPLAPRNPMVTSPYKIGSTDIRWDNPRLIPQNNHLNIVGVNVYRSTENPYGPYVKVNSTPVGVLYFRDETKEVYTTENATPTVRYLDVPDKRWYIYAQRKPLIQPGTNGRITDRIEDVKLEIDDGDGTFLEVPAFTVSGQTGEITLISNPTFNNVINQVIPPRLPWPPNGRIRLSYTYLSNQVLSQLNQRIYYKVTTVAVDPNDPSKRIETPLDEAEFRSTFDMEEIDWIWREGIRRNRWMLEQSGERVKVFTRMWMGERCPNYEDSHGQSHQDCETCFPAGSMVTLADGSKKDIRNISESDYILSSQGLPEKVTGIFNRNINEDLFEIEIVGKDSIQCTQKHPFLIIKKEDAYCKRLGSKRNKCVPMKKSCCFKGYHTNGSDCQYRPEPVWAYAYELQEGDYLLTPKIKTEKNVFSNDEMFLFGFYTAEGSVSLNGSKKSLNRLRFGFGKQETEILSIVREIFERQYQIKLNYCQNKTGAHELWCCNKFIADEFIKNCGQFAKNKKLSKDLMGSDKESISWFLGGYLLGDGHISKNKAHLGAAFYSTVSPDLASQIELLFIKLGIPVSTHYIYHEDARPNKSGWIFVGRTPSVSMNIIPLLGRKKIYREIKKVQHKILPLDNFVAYTVKKINKKRFSGEVYNIETGNFHSYLINNIAVHNCFGTSYIGGYFGPIDIIIAPPEAEKSIELMDMGLHIRYDFETWTGPFPMLNERDVIVRQNNERYVVGPVNPQGSRGAIYQQHFTITYVDEKDIRYKIGITGGETEVPPSSDMYRQDRLSDASPVIPVKPTIAKERLIKGRTVTFENIMY